MYSMQVQPSALCKAVDVPRLLDDIRAYYSSPTHSGKHALDVSECREIRRGLLSVARLMLRSSVQPGNWTAKKSWAQVQVLPSCKILAHSARILQSEAGELVFLSRGSEF